MEGAPGFWTLESRLSLVWVYEVWSDECGAHKP